MTFRGILRGVGKALKWGIITLALIYGALFAINAVDEDLSPEAKTLMVLPQIKEDPDNGYLALVGLNAPANEDIFIYGKQWVDTFNAANDATSLEKANARFKYSKPQFRGDEKLLCNPSRTPCLPEARKKADLWRKLNADNEMLHARQQRLISFTHFEESYFPSSPGAPMPSFSSPQRLLELDLIALDAVEGRLVPALAALEARIAFDRRALLGSRSLLMGLVACNWLGQDYALLAEMVATRSPVLMSQKARLARMTDPLDTEQMRALICRQVEGEKRMLSRWMLDKQTAGAICSYYMQGPVDMPGQFFRPHASQNLLARNHNALQARIREFSPERSEAWIAKAQQDDQREDDVTIHSWRFLYNPIGKIAVTRETRFQYEAYILKHYNLVGITRLARLQTEVVTERTAVEEIPARIAADKALFDPYTSKPMGWDAGKRQLYFDAHGNVPPEKPKRMYAGI